MNDLVPRPSLRDDYVRRRAAEIIMPQIRGWSAPAASEETGWMKSLARAAGLAGGYEIAKSLERGGWCVDAGLVEILDGGWVQDAIDELTAQWVRCLNIRPQFEVGAQITCSIRTEPGVIVNIDTRLAKYGVRYPDMKDSSYYVVAFEGCAAAVMAEATATP